MYRRIFLAKCRNLNSQWNNNPWNQKNNISYQFKCTKIHHRIKWLKGWLESKNSKLILHNPLIYFYLSDKVMFPILTVFPMCDTLMATSFHHSIDTRGPHHVLSKIYKNCKRLPSNEILVFRKKLNHHI